MSKVQLQMDIEKSCDPSTIKRTLRNMIIEHMGSVIDVAEEYLYQYANYTYWESKNERIANISPCVCLRSVAIDILAAIVTVEHPQQIQNIAAQIGSRLMYADKIDGIKTAAEMIGVLAHTGVYEFIYPKDSETGSILIKNLYDVSPEVTDLINRAMYLPPMLVPPQKIEDNKSSGYLCTTKSILLGKASHHDLKLPLDVVNKQNAIPYSLDPRMLAFPETPKKPHASGDKYEATPDWAKAAYVERKTTAFNNMCRVSTEVYNMLLDNGNRFYITNRVDERIRDYSQGYHVNHQGSSYKRSIIDFADKEVIS